MALPCPLPLVEEALRPYIHTRQETLHIRRAVTQQCAGQFRPLDDDDEQQSVSHLALACPLSPTSHDEADSSSKARRRQQQQQQQQQRRQEASGGSEEEVEFTGLRKKYMDALQAHRAARERYDALASELHEMRVLDTTGERGREERELVAGTGGGGGQPGGVQSHISLLRQRRRLARLQVLQATLDQLADTQANPTRVDLRELLRKRVGEPPNPPSSSSAAHAADGTGEGGNAIRDLVFRLKKDLLLAKRSLDAENGARAAVQRRLASSDQCNGVDGNHREGGKAALATQVRALRCARDELISWVEAELAKIGVEDGDRDDYDDAQGTRPDDYDDDNNNAESSYQDQVQAMYDRYLSSRAALLEAIATAAKTQSQPSPSPSPSPAKQGPNPPKQVEPASLPPSTILPLVPPLLHHAHTSRALLTQTTYLRHRLDSSTDALRQLVQRLASESHLVPHHATSSREWARAAAEAAAETDAFVEGCVRRGEGHVEGAREVLGELGGRRGAFGVLGLGVGEGEV